MTLPRREFITLFGGAAAWPMAARAQQALPVWDISAVERRMHLRRLRSPSIGV